MCRNIKRILIVILSVVMLLHITGCSSTTSGKTPSNYEQLYPLIGKPITEACKALGLDEAAVISAMNKRETYPVGTVEYAGIRWDVVLYLEGATESVYGIGYVSNYDSGSIDQAAKDTVPLADHLQKHYGEPQDPNGDSLCSLSAKQLQEGGHKAAYWELTDQVNASMQENFQKYVAAVEGNLDPGLVPKTLHYRMYLDYVGIPGEGVCLMLEYKLDYSVS